MRSDSPGQAVVGCFNIILDVDTKRDGSSSAAPKNKIAEDCVFFLSVRGTAESLARDWVGSGVRV